ncbi:MAG: dTDP-4-keto-6-deoxy-D-glucose epimerase [Nitrospira sp.]|nr:dTDP-4-keto-6-deoxy-D-glucose epimerase [Nitrospira sp.]
MCTVARVNHSLYYSPQHERCIIWEDPTIGINRPFEGIPVISGKDRQGTRFVQAECFK